MAKTVLKDAIILFDKRDISGLLNQVALEYSAELQDNTTFGGNGTRSRQPGLLDISLGINGYWDADSNGGELSADLDFFNNIGAAGSVPSTVIPSAGVAGDEAFFFDSREASYSPGATIGEMFAFAVEINSAGPLISGQVAHNGIITSTTNGVQITLPAVAAGQKIYAVQHVVNSDGDGTQTLDTVLVSDSDSLFDSATATDRITFAQVGAANAAEQANLAGPITDTEWRAEMAVAGSGSPSFTVIIVIGVK